MNEAGFKTKVKKAVNAKGIYCLATSERFNRGVPDHWYSGPAGDLWVEYKYDDKSKTILPNLSDHQLRWLNDRYTEGRNVSVIVATGTDKGLIYVGGEWNSTKKPKAESLPFNELIDFIREITITGTSNDNPLRIPSKNPSDSEPRYLIANPAIYYGQRP